MKMILAIVASLTLLMSGCATSNYSVGRDFSSESVQQIVKGETTTEDLISIFGEPFSKNIISATEEKWIYMYAEGTAKAQSYMVTVNYETTGTQKMLDILITGGVVVNFAYTEGKNPYTIQVN